MAKVIKKIRRAIRKIMGKSLLSKYGDYVGMEIFRKDMSSDKSWFSTSLVILMRCLPDESISCGVYDRKKRGF